MFEFKFIDELMLMESLGKNVTTCRNSSHVFQNEKSVKWSIRPITCRKSCGHELSETGSRHSRIAQALYNDVSSE